MIGARKQTVLKVLGAILALSLVSTASQAASVAGTVLAIKGTVSVTGAGDTRTLAKGDALHVGEKISTAAGSYAVIEFIDGAKATVRPNSELVVDKYAYGSADDGAVLNLVKGGLRALTGAIGKEQPDNFKVRTNVATLGVRGTEFDIRLCEKDCVTDQRRAELQLPGIQGYGYSILEN